MQIAELTAAENRDRVPELLIDACNVLLPSNDGMVAIFGCDIKPIALYDNVPHHLHARVIDSYYDGAYLLDPYYRAGIGGIDSGLYRLEDVAPPGFRQSEYYRRYYRESRTGDEVGFIVQLADGRFGYVALAMQSDQPRFRKAEVDRLRLAQPIVDRVMREYWRHLQDQVIRRGDTLHSQLEVALACFGDSVLTSREAEVLRHYLQGHSTRSISERLSITTHTVSMHRKNAYAKLDISSQYELFHLFIDALRCFDPVARQDPLTAYLGAR